jgi:UDP-glucose 4-epimerase
VKVLVTGANGFLGQHVVRVFLARGVGVRALVRPGQPIDQFDWSGHVDVYRDDLRSPCDLRSAFDGVDVLVHLAAAVRGDRGPQFATTVAGTRHLLAAMAATATSRLVLVSSFAVYGFDAIEGTLDENAPLATDLDDRDVYSTAKACQERLVRSLAATHGWDLRVLRPGVIWGKGNEEIARVGHRLGKVTVVFGLPGRLMALTHVENCADCVVATALSERAAGETFNVVDDSGFSAWEYEGHRLRAGGAGGRRLCVPYRLGYAACCLVAGLSRLWPGTGKRLPDILVPSRFEARFKPLRFSNSKLREVVGWTPPHDRATCLERTFGAERAQARD